ncbi:hypothetical protein CDD83_5557 [Cordyceps sp. RAO-2017]|nr:hypothetical protein CDD83_5557 [Cordyceps sp. RAO-2017]
MAVSPSTCCSSSGPAPCPCSSSPFSSATARQASTADSAASTTDCSASATDPVPAPAADPARAEGPSRRRRNGSDTEAGVTGPDGTASRKTYVVDMSRALILFGAPTHRLEQYLQHTSRALGLPLQSYYLPGCMTVSFGPGDVHMIRCAQALNLAKLHDVHRVYKDVFPCWLRVLSYGLACACIGPVSFNAQPVDLPVIFVLGSLVGFLELVLAPRNELYGYVFDVSSAVLSSCLGRAFGSVHWGGGRHRFCFPAIAQAPIVMILPGFTITNSALELQSRNVVSGAVRLVYGVVFTLFLAFGFTVGIAIYGAVDGNATSVTKCEPSFAVWWPLAFVLPFTFCYVVVNQARWRNMPAMLAVALAGWAVNHFSAERLAAVPALPQALGALAVGVLANLYSRLGRGLAAALMQPAIFIQVPGSLAASGSLISGLTNADRLIRNVRNATDPLSYRQATVSELDAGYAMVNIAIGITVGLSVSVILVYPLRKKGSSGIFSF